MGRVAGRLAQHTAEHRIIAVAKAMLDTHLRISQTGGKGRKPTNGFAFVLAAGRFEVLS